MFFYRFFRISVCLIFEILVRRIASRIAARDERIASSGGVRCVTRVHGLQQGLRQVVCGA